jgi:hypothetical protein
MTMSAIAIDHIQELLALVVRFTSARRHVLQNNMRHMDREGFVPHDLAVLEFTQQLHAAITEHVTHHRLVLRDDPHIRFGANGEVELIPEPDSQAELLLRSDPEAYLQYQMHHLVETILNERVARKMLRSYIGLLARRGIHDTGPSRSCWPPERTPLIDDRMDL